jgi:hypothetical protein
MGITTRTSAAITMSASTAFADELFLNTTDSTTAPSIAASSSAPPIATQASISSTSKEDLIYDFDVTVDSHNLFEVIAAAVTSYAGQTADQPKDIVFTIQQTDKTSGLKIKFHL